MCSRRTATLTLTASVSTVPVGQNVTFQFKMSPFVQGANVTLVYSLDNKTALPIANLVMTSPSMSYSWKVDIKGTFWVRLIFQGSQNYNKALSPAVKFTTT